MNDLLKSAKRVVDLFPERPGTPRGDAIENLRNRVKIADGTFDRYTDRARKVLTLAEEYAVELGHQYVGTEHLLVGLLREGEGIGAGVAQSMGLETKKVEAAVEFIVGKKTGSG